MKSKKEIEQEIADIERTYEHILTGSMATVDVNAPRALQQISVHGQLKALHWVLGTKFQSKLKGVNT